MRIAFPSKVYRPVYTKRVQHISGRRLQFTNVRFTSVHRHVAVFLDFDVFLQILQVERSRAEISQVGCSFVLAVGWANGHVTHSCLFSRKTPTTDANINIVFQTYSVVPIDFVYRSRRPESIGTVNGRETATVPQHSFASQTFAFGTSVRLTINSYCSRSSYGIIIENA